MSKPARFAEKLEQLHLLIVRRLLVVVVLAALRGSVCGPGGNRSWVGMGGLMAGVPEEGVGGEEGQ